MKNIKLLASYDYYEDVKNNVAVTLMCDYRNNLIAFKNKLDRLPILQRLDNSMYKEFSEILLAKDGEQLDFKSAAIYFPYLKNINFWIDEKWGNYLDQDFKTLITQTL